MVCYNCFKEINSGSAMCSHCGFTLKGYEIPSWSLSPGTILNGKYLIGKRLGEGGFGITYLAWDTNMLTKVAIKEYYPDGVATRDTTTAEGNTVITKRDSEKNFFDRGMKRYVQEASTLSKFFDLPGIVTVKDFFYENATAYIVMEYIDGVSLKDYIKKNGGTIKYTEALELVKPVITSLAVVHKNNLLHRDISPDNIMMDRKGNVKLIDFGAAREFGENNEKSVTVMLKHGYAPVEQYSSRGNHGEWSDVYSMCAVLYRCVTGQAPVESIDRISKDTYIPVRELNKKLPKHFCMAIDKGLALDPENRYQNMDELYNDLYSSAKTRATKTATKTANGVARFFKKLLITVALIVIMLGAGFVAYKLNEDKIEAFLDGELVDKPAQVVEADSSSEIEMSSLDALMGTDSGNVAKEDEVDTKEENDIKVEDGTTAAKPGDVVYTKKKKEYVVPTPEEELITDTESDENVLKAIDVVAGGIVDGRSSDMTVGEILDTYSDSEGEWVGKVKSEEQTCVYYQGTKDGSTFAFEFEVYNDNTFKMTGAAKSGKKIDKPNAFFKEVLDTVGA